MNWYHLDYGTYRSLPWTIQRDFDEWCWVLYNNGKEVGRFRRLRYAKRYARSIERALVDA